MNAISISDLHLGSGYTSENLLNFLNSIETDKLILNGDIFDSLNLNRFNNYDWKILNKLRSLNTKIIWINGNHDGKSERISDLLGVKVFDEYILESGNKKILFIHGHKFDNFIIKRPILTWIVTQIYWFLQKLDKNKKIARWLKRKSKQYLRCKEVIKRSAIEYMSNLGCDFVCCGHTHFAEIEKNYFNSGCWTEEPGSYITIQNGVLNLNYYNLYS